MIASAYSYERRRRALLALIAHATTTHAEREAAKAALARLISNSEPADV
jgi:hypothetical protein